MRYSNKMLKLLGYNNDNGVVSEVIVVFKLYRVEADVFSRHDSTYVAFLTSAAHKGLMSGGVDSTAANSKGEYIITVVAPSTMRVY